jgi:hypothetical protein
MKVSSESSRIYLSITKALFGGKQMWDTVRTWLLWALILGIGSAIASVLLYVLAFANLKRLLFIGKLRTFLRDIPDDAPLMCDDGEVSATFRQPGQASEEHVKLYSGGITWKGGSRLASKVKRAAARQYPLRLALFILVFMPLLLGSLYLGIMWDWRMLGIVLLLVFHQFFPFYVFVHPLVADLFEGVK